MELTQQTFDVLSNFSTINQGIVVAKGKVVKTMSPGRHILAEATLDVEFPRDFAIADLKQLLNVLGLFNPPNLEFEDHFLTIGDKESQSRYLYSPPKHVQGYTERGYPNIKLPSEEIKFELSEANLGAVMRAGAVMQMPHIAIVGESGKQKIMVCNSASPTTNTYERALGETPHTFCMVYLREYWKFLPRTYQVAVSSKGLACLSATDVRYFVAAESNSTFG